MVLNTFENNFSLKGTLDIKVFLQVLGSRAFYCTGAKLYKAFGGFGGSCAKSDKLPHVMSLGSEDENEKRELSRPLQSAALVFSWLAAQGYI